MWPIQQAWWGLWADDALLGECAILLAAAMVAVLACLVDTSPALVVVLGEAQALLPHAQAVG